MKSKHSFLFFVILLTGLLLSACTGDAASLASSWPGLTVDQDTLYAAYNQQVSAINLTNRTIVWQYPVKKDPKINFYTPPALAPDGQIIVGGYNHILYSLNQANGTEMWSFAGAKSRYIGSPLVGPDAIYAPNADHNLYALDFSGKLVWTFTSDGPLWATPMAGPDCACLYVPSMDHFVYAVDAKSGSQIWKSEDLGGSVVGTPAYGTNGLIYVGTFDSEMLALDANTGKIVWRTTTAGWVWSGPLLQDGTLYFGDLSGTIYSIAADTGRVNWNLKPDGPIANPPLITADGLYFASQSGALVAVDMAGAVRWNVPVGGKLYTSPVGFDDLIVAAPTGTDELLFAYNTAGTQQWPFILEPKK